MEWDKVNAAVDPTLERPHPKEPELVSVDHLPWYPIQPNCVKKRLRNEVNRDLAKLVEQPFRLLPGPQPWSNGGHDAFNVQDTLCLLYICLLYTSDAADE